MSIGKTLPFDAPSAVGQLLDDAAQRRASDLHVEPTASGYDLKLRIDGLLTPAGTLPAADGRAVVTRLMVLASLLTYRLDIPQEGRLSVAVPSSPGPLDLRLSVMPTTHGMRAAVRLPAELTQPRRLEDLGLPEAALSGLRDFASADAGMLLLTGPAGSGKTTTIYALLAHLLEATPGVSVIALEDPVERDLPGVTQIQVQPFGELTYERALRSMLRQDPQVLMLGEIRDAATASVAVQAALSGHRLVSTLHAATPGGALARLLEMGVEPYQLTSAVFAVVAQRLLRRKTAATDAGAGGSSYAGRVPVAEIARMDGPLREAVLRRDDAKKMQEALHRLPRHATLSSAADALVARGETDEAEVRRVLGPPEMKATDKQPAGE